VAAANLLVALQGLLRLTPGTSATVETHLRAMWQVAEAAGTEADQHTALEAVAVVRTSMAF
jgi:hypothetical protein